MELQGRTTASGGKVGLGPESRFSPRLAPHFRRRNWIRKLHSSPEASRSRFRSFKACDRGR
jgi:hypothetical protein